MSYTGFEPDTSELEKKIEELKTYYKAVIPEKIEVLGFEVTREHITILGLVLALIGLLAIGIKKAVKSEVEGYIDLFSEMDLE